MRWLTRESPAKGRNSSKRRRTRRQPRRRAMAPRWAKQAILAVGGIVAIGGLIGGPVYLWQSGIAARTYDQARSDLLAASARMGLHVSEVLVVGRNQTTKGELLQALHARRGDPILAVDPDALRQRVEALPWVRRAAIERRLPDTIQIRIAERRPMAWWQRNGKLALVDFEGVVVPTSRSERERYSHLLTIIGPDAPKHAPSLLAMLAREPALASRVTAATRVGKRRWNLRMDQGVDIRLPEADAASAWVRFAAVERVRGILSRDIVAVDLRLPDRMIVQTRKPPKSDKSTKGRPT